MKSTGMTRRIDELGRIVLPAELRRNLGLDERAELEISVEGVNIVLKKVSRHCIFCGGEKMLAEYKNEQVCSSCIKGISSILQEL
jgi:transcriptional pleiotropic regulator of transition state genes